MSLIFLSIAHRSNGSRLRMRAVLRDAAARLIGAGFDLHELVADQAVVLDRGDRIDAKELDEDPPESAISRETRADGSDGT